MQRREGIHRPSTTHRIHIIVLSGNVCHLHLSRRKATRRVRLSSPPSPPPHHRCQLFVNVSVLSSLIGLLVVALHLARLGVGAQLAAEQQNVRLRLVDVVVDPAATLHDAHLTPFGLGEQLVLLAATDLIHLASNGMRQNDVAILIHIVLVLVRVFDGVGIVRHGRITLQSPQSPLPSPL
uniref:Uncharacterized protein n=1 Tax=Vitrella brassicaformis TaxID=1169539 RepID=A0A7S1K6K4_9ALVE